MMKYCRNGECKMYGRLIYTQATRCVCCRWDLQPTRQKSEIAVERKQRPPTAA